MKILKNTFITAGNEFQDAYHSRIVLVWVTLFLAVALLSGTAFIKILSEIESQILNSTLQDDYSAKAGTLVTRLQHHKEYRTFIENMFDDKSIAQTVIETPPLALFYGIYALFISPLLVLFLASGTIAQDVGKGTTRFILFRTSRLSWITGKALSQALLVFFALSLGAVCYWIIGYFGISGFDMPSNAWHLCIMTLKAWIYSLPFLGLALGASQWTRSSKLALTLAIILLIGIKILSVYADKYSGDGFSRIWELLYMLTPQSQYLNLWRRDIGSILHALGFCLILGIIYTYAGYTRFSRKDL